MNRVRIGIATGLVCSCLLHRAQAAAVEPVVAVGRPCTYAVRGDGTLWAWGRKGPQLGVGISSPLPVGTQWRPLQIGTGTDWRTVASAGYHALAIRADGSLWGWGQGASAIGVATLGPDAVYPWYYPSPIRVGTDADWKAVGTGWDGSAGIKTDGSLWAWGSLYKDRAPGEPLVGTPKRLGTDGDWELLAVGPNHALAIKRDGSLWAWGGGSHAQTAGVGGARPEQLGTDADWVAVSTGEYHTLALKADGSLWGWGWKFSLGLPGFDDQTSPLRLHPDADWAAIAVGATHSLAVRKDGTLWAWGDNREAQCGVMPRTWRLGFTRVGAYTDWKEVFSTPSVNSFGLRASGELYAWGTDGLGTENVRFLERPTPVSSGWAAVEAGDSFAVGIRENGTLWAWGASRRNVHPVLGVDDPLDRASPIPVRAGETWLAVSAGHLHTVALRADRTLWSWGENYCGELGRGTGGEGNGDSLPGRIGTAGTWRALSAGYRHTLAIQEDGSLWAWGRNTEGQLGIGADADPHEVHDRPLRVGGDSDWVGVAAGMYLSAALKRDGSMWVWGEGLGDRPESLPAAGPWARVSAEWRRFVAVKGDGTLWTFGRTSYDEPFGLAQVGPEDSWERAAAENRSATALRRDGTLWAWGRNEYGQLGLGYCSYEAAGPTRIGRADDWADLSVGNFSFVSSFTLALKKDGSLWAWGDNYSGQSGTGIFGFGPEPTRIFGPPMGTASLAASSDLVTSGDGATLSWATTATSCTMSGGVGAVPPRGSVIVRPRRTASYTLTCRDEKRAEVQSAGILVLANEVRNGSFEEGARLPQGWTANRLRSGDRLTAESRRAGRQSLRLSGTAAAKGVRQVIATPGRAGTVFTLSAWSRSLGLRRSGGVHALQARILHRDGTQRIVTVPLPRNSAAWRYRQRAFVVAKDFAQIELRLRFERQSGRAWFDDVRLIRK